MDTMGKDSSSKNVDDGEDLTNLIINYLPPTMSEGTLATLFSPYGLLERCKIVVDLQTLRSRGYGFVKYDNPISAERALNALNGYELNGKKLKVAFARQQCKAITNSNLYLTNIPPHFTDSNLVKLFNDFGKIIECRVLMDQNGQSRGVGFVRMDTHHNAIQALQAMDQYVIDDKHPPLLVKLAQRRVPRRYWNNQNRGGGMGGNQGRGRGGGGGRGRGRAKGRNRGYQKNNPGQRQQQQYQPMGPQMMGMEQAMGQMNMGMANKPRGGGGSSGGGARNLYHYRQKQPYGQQAAQQPYKQKPRGMQQSPQYGQQRPNQGGHYAFPAAMYDAPYGMAPQYPQAYAPNMHMGMQQGQGGNPSGVGAPSGYYGQHGQYMPDMAAFSASAASYPSTQ